MTIDIWQSSIGKKCLTGTQNLRQHFVSLPDKMSGTPEIIFAITGVLISDGKILIPELDSDCLKKSPMPPLHY